MRILVAGCAGFIGYHLTKHLLDAGHEIVGLDNFVSGNRANVAALAQHRDFMFVEQDIIVPFDFDGPCQRIYDLACPASPADFGPRSLEILATCSRGVWNLLELARAKGARFLHASTSEVYGDPREHPQPETYWGNVNPVGPRACYDEGKRFAEALITAYAAEHGVSARLPRIFNTYGPHMRSDDGRMLPTFIGQALRGEPLTVHGDGTQTRSFCYVSDLVDGLVRLMESDVVGPVNLGNPVEITVLEAAQEVVALTNSSSRIDHMPRPADDPTVRQPDIARARRELSWEPQVARTDGFARTVAWFRAQQEMPG